MNRPINILSFQPETIFGTTPSRAWRPFEMPVEICDDCGCLYRPRLECYTAALYRCHSCRAARYKVKTERILRYLRNMDFASLEQRILAMALGQPSRVSHTAHNAVIQGSVTGRIYHDELLMEEVPRRAGIIGREADIFVLDDGLREVGVHSPRVEWGIPRGTIEMTLTFDEFNVNMRAMSQLMGSYFPTPTPTQEAPVKDSPREAEKKWWDGKSRQHAIGSGIDYRKRDRARQKRQGRRK